MPVVAGWQGHFVAMLPMLPDFAVIKKPLKTVDISKFKTFTVPVSIDAVVTLAAVIVDLTVAIVAVEPIVGYVVATQPEKY